MTMVAAVARRALSALRGGRGTSAGSADTRDSRDSREGTSERERRRAEREAQQAAKHQAREERAARKQAELAAQEEAAATAYANYRRVREWAVVMRDRYDHASLSGERDRTVAAGLAHLWDAPPATIAVLRRWCEPLSGVRASDYEPPSEDLARQLGNQAAAMRNHRMELELFVGDPPALGGGFGVARYGLRFDSESVQWFPCVAALQDAAVLTQFRASAGRQLVWEIDGGWGGFAYMFKTLCPNVTYLVTGHPATLLVSATYLMSAFPGAVCRFFGEQADLWTDWQGADFVFAPEAALGRPGDMAPPRLDLTLDVMAMRHMDDHRLSTYVRRAHEWQSLYFYSAVPGPSAVDDAARVWGQMGRHYWMHQVPPLGKVGVECPPRAPQTEPAHSLGWRRLRV